MATSALTSGPTPALTSGPPGPGPASDAASQLTAALQAMLPDLGLGGVLGVATGYAVKAVGRAALIVVGLSFLLVQVLSAYGVLTVDWLRLQTLTEPWLRGGRENLGGWVSRVLLANVPFAGAFVAGFVLGLRLR